MSESMNKVLPEPTPSSMGIEPPLINLWGYQLARLASQTHKQQVWQVLFVPYPTLRHYVFQGTGPPNELKWSFFLPVHMTKFQPMDLRGYLLGSIQEKLCSLIEMLKEKLDFSTSGYCLCRIRRSAAAILRSWEKLTCWGWPTENMESAWGLDGIMESLSRQTLKSPIVCTSC